MLLIASGGVHEPGDALALRHAGADLVQADSGLVYTGPGLPKRINDVLLFETTRLENHPSPPAPLPEGEGRNMPTQASPPAPLPEGEKRNNAEMSWFWTFLMGAGMLLGSVMALVIAATRVVLPYDEMFVNMSRDELHNVNPRLLAFMAHDRVSLAGTMVAIGVMYVGLSLFGIRRGLHWAQLSVFVSAFVGFASFFLFLGFEYFDNFHAFVTLALLQLLLPRGPCQGGHAYSHGRNAVTRGCRLASQSVGPALADRARVRLARRRADDLEHRRHACVRA